MGLWNKIVAKLRAMTYYKLCFRQYGKHTLILRPLLLEGKKNISIGDRTFIYDQVWLAAMPLTENKNPELRIGNNCGLGHLNHIYATNRIVLEDSVLTADKVYISDTLHAYENPNIPIKEQEVRSPKEVIIGEGSWLGENVCIIGASIGKHCVIGANAVVTHDIPDYCVAVGSPARVIKRYNFKTQQWEKVEDK